MRWLGAVAAAAAVVSLAGCGGGGTSSADGGTASASATSTAASTSVVSQADLEKRIGDEYTQQLGLGDPEVSCPGQLTGPVGNTMTCTIYLKRTDHAYGQVAVEATVTSVLDYGLEYKLALSGSSASASASAGATSLGSTTKSSLSRFALASQIQDHLNIAWPEPFVLCDTGLKGPVGTKAECTVYESRNVTTSKSVPLEVTVTAASAHSIQYTVKQTSGPAGE